MGTLRRALGALRDRAGGKRPSTHVRLSNVDRAWWRMETPSNLMMITAVLLFDSMPDLERLRERLRRRVGEIPRLSQRVVEPPRGRPRWVDVPAIDFDVHLRHERLEHDDDASVWDRVSRLVSTPLNRSRPLWALDAIELPSGRCVLLARLHHSIGDGIASMLVLLSLTDTSPEMVEDEVNPLVHLFERGRTDLRLARAFVARLLPGGMKLMQRERVSQRRIGPRTLARVAKTAIELFLLPSDPPSVLRGPLQVEKRVAWSRGMSLGQIKALAAAHGCTINDLLTALVTGAVRRYLEGEGARAPSFDLRAAVPINLRKLEKMAELGNRFGLVFVPLPLAIEDPVERVAEVRRRIDALKGSLQPIVTYGILHVIGAGPGFLEDWVVDLFAKKATAVMTNVPGPVRTLYLAGQPIRSLVYWVPQTARVGIGISVSSYADEVRIGIAADAGLVSEPATLIDCFHEELEASMMAVRLDESA